MALAAVITREPRLTLTEWEACARKNAHLRRSTQRSRINPFTHKRVPNRVPPGEFLLHEAGEVFGTMELDEDFDNNGEILVWTQHEPDEHIVFIVTQVARALRARIEWCWIDGDFESR